MAPTYFEVILGFIGPWRFMGLSVSFVPGTILRLVRSGSWRTLLSPSAFHDAWFSDFWAVVGPQVQQGASARVVPLLRGHVRGGAATSDDDQAHPPVSGTVLEIGPGSGLWVHMFAPGALNAQPQIEGKDGDDETAAVRSRRRENASAAINTTARSAPAIKRVLGVEPNHALHPALKASAANAGLADVYEIVPVGIESLAKTGAVARGEVDSIVSILCLCGIPDPERNIRELYSYLKPGGRWYVYEHVRCESCQTMVWYQALVNIFWPIALGGCQLRKETEKSLRSAGAWANVDLAHPPDEQWFATVPHILGVLTK